MLYFPRKLSPAALALLVGCAVPFASLAATAVPAQTPQAGTSAPVSASAAISDPPGLPADADPTTVVGHIQGKPITLGELTKFAAGHLKEQQTIYQVRRAQLDIEYQRAQQQTLEEELKRSLDKQVLALEADARKMNVLKLTGQVSVPAVTDDEVRARYESRKGQGTPPFDQVAAQIRKGLEDERAKSTMETYYASLRTKYGASGSVQPLRQDVGTDGPSAGPADAPITIVEFADFQCPFCRRMEPTLKKVMAEYPKQVRLVYRQFPLSEIHPQALHAAEAALCAKRQGKFWEMHDAIFTDSAPLGTDSLRAIAARVGLDEDAFEQCVRDPEVDKAINVDLHAGEELGVRATPTLFVNGRFLEGGVPEEQVVALIEDELKHAPSGAKTAAR